MAGARAEVLREDEAAWGASSGRQGMATVRVLGACLAGTGAELVTIEARYDKAGKDELELVITGLPDPVIRESRAVEIAGHIDRSVRRDLDAVRCAIRRDVHRADDLLSL